MTAEDRKMTAALIALAVLMISGIWYCSTNTKKCLENCRYSSKRFVEAHTEVWYSSHCISSDKDGTCVISIPIEHEDFVPDAWYVSYQDCLGGAHEFKVDEASYLEPKLSVVHEHLRWKECKCL